MVGAQRSRGRVLGTDVEKAAKIQIVKDFGGHDKDNYISRVMESLGGLWAGEDHLDYSSWSLMRRRTCIKWVLP